MPIRIPKIKQLSTVSGEPGTLSVIGLGDDNKVYFWSYAAGSWVPHWNFNDAPVAAAATAAAGVSPGAPPVADVQPKKKRAQG